MNDRRSPPLTPDQAGALRDEYFAWREERGLEPTWGFCLRVAQFHRRTAATAGFPMLAEAWARRRR